MTLVAPSLEHCFDAVIDVGPPLDHGITRAGHRRVIPITGGRLTGAVTATIVPGGADWQVVEPDGTVVIDARYTASATSGHLVDLRCRGFRTGPPEVLAAIRAGEPVDPADYTFRTTVQIETADPDLAHLQHRIIISTCERRAAQIRFAAFVVR